MDGVEQNIFTIHGGHIMKHDLPVFDIANIETDKALQSDIIAAEEEYGAYLFTGYDPKIETCLLETQKVARAFFERPLEDKMRFDYAQYDHDGGYFPKGGEKSAHGTQADTLEYFMIGPKEATSEALKEVFCPRPQVETVFDKTLSNMYEAFQQLDYRLSVPLSLYIFGDEKTIWDGSVHGNHKLRVTFGAQKGNSIAPHRDRSRQTILFPRQPGLTIESRKGEQVSVIAEEGMGLKNNGYQLGWLTNDAVLPCNHWAEAKNDGRMSIVYFGHMNADFMLQPQSKFADRTPVEGYPDKPMTVTEYAIYRKTFNDPYSTKTESYKSAKDAA